MRKVVFIHRFGPQTASYRYRCEIPATYLNLNGWQASINHGEAEIVVFAKPVEDDVRLALDLKSRGVKIVFDVTDPHFHLEHYKEMFQLAGTITCSSKWSLDNFPGMDYGIEYIPDPYEFDLVSPHADGDNLLWFGHKTNLKDVEKYSKLDNLKIVTGPDHIEGTVFHSPENLERAMSEANLVLLPTRKGAEYKSPNRLVNSLRRGLFPICDKHPAYEEFRTFCWTNDINTGLRFAKKEHGFINEMVASGQKYIEKYSPERVGEQWKQLLDSI